MRGDGDYKLLWRRGGSRGSGGSGRGGEARVSRGAVETSPLPRQGSQPAPSLTLGGVSLQLLPGPATPGPPAPLPTIAAQTQCRNGIQMVINHWPRR